MRWPTRNMVVSAATPIRSPWLRMWVIAAVLAGLVAVVWLRLWWPLGAPSAALRWDALWEYWGDLWLQSRAMARGELLLWNPNERMGYPFYADPQVGTIYPLQWLLAAVGLLIGEVPYWLIVVKNLFHVWLLGVGMVVWLRRQGVGVAACYLGAVALVLSYSVVANAPSALNWSFAYTPWVLVAGERWLERPSARRALCVAAVAGMMIGAGAYGAVWYGALLAGPWLVARACTQWWSLPPGRRGGYVLAVAGGFSLIVAVDAVLCGAQGWATWSVLPQTERVAHGLGGKVAFYAQSGMKGADAWNLLVPWRAGLPVFLGVVPLVGMMGAIWWLSRPSGISPAPTSSRCGWHSRAWWWWWALAVLGGLWAVGDATPCLRWAAAVVPPFAWFRMAHRYLYVVGFAVAALAALGVHAMQVAWGPRLVARWGQRWVAWAMAGVVAGAAGEQVAWRYGVVRRGLAAVPSTARDAWSAVGARARDESRIYDRGWLGYRPGARLSVRDFGGYEDDPLALARYARVRNWVRDDLNRVGAVGIARVGVDEATLRAKPFAADPRALTKRTTESADVREPGAGWYEARTPMPDAYWVSGAQVAPTAAAAFARFSARIGNVVGGRLGDLDWRHELASAVAIEEAYVALVPDAVGVDYGGAPSAGVAPATRAALATPAVPVASDAHAPHRVRYAFEAPAAGILVTSELFFNQGWTATVNGLRAPIVPINGFARAVAVPSGFVQIEMTFDMPWYRWGVAIALVGWGVITAAGAMSLIQRLRRLGSA